MTLAKFINAIIALPFVLSLMTGCAQSVSKPRDSAMHGRGSVMTGPHQERAEAALAKLSCLAGDRSLRVTVFDSNDIAAYCWPSGKIVMTLGLLKLVDDQELIAAIAHEIGHLLADGHIPRHAALAGCHSDPDAETEADLVARELLRAGDLQHEALARLLQKVASHPQTTPTCRERLNRRVTRLAALH